jgi:imidazole glycerol-phosphate synthase subunit HisH
MGVAIIDYGAGNIRSVENALRVLGYQAELTGDPDRIAGADHVILPGVGSFGDAMHNIREKGLEDVIHHVCRKGTPFLGICLGLQILFDESEESPGVKGLSILKGKVVRFSPDLPDPFRRRNGSENAVLKVPEIGWNALSYPGASDGVRAGRLFEGVPEGSYVYYVHSYYLEAWDPAIVKARSEYGVSFDASVEQGNVFACQFHPEKSERIGMQILQNFMRIDA